MHSMNFLAVKAAAEAYEDQPQEMQNFVITRGDLRAVSFVSNGRLFVGIRGTENADNWLRNLRYYPSRISGLGLVHAGFKSAASDLLDDVKSLLSDSQLKLVFSGHSMGGAVASILAETLAKEGIFSAVRTFGAPKHWGRFVRLRCDTITYQIDDDPVPKLPPRTPIGLIYGHKGRILTFDDAGWFSVGDHKIKRYIHHMEQIENLEK